MGNVRNLLNDMDEEKVTIEVLANSEAIMYLDATENLDADLNTMESLNKRNVKFVACNNALTAYDVKKEMLFPFVDIVPAGVVELVKRQREGYAYIKP